MSRLRSHSPKLALAIITLIGLVGFVDRIVVNAVVEPLKAEFGLSDAQIGLLGFAYSGLNIVLGVIVARFAESRRRLTFTAVGTLLWSIAATGCGFVSGWYQLLAARIAVGVGEAVGLPANQSLIADYYPPERRATAMSVLLLAAPLGAFVGLAGGGYIAQIWGWRWAFIVTGVPGLLLAAVVWLFLREPERGRFDVMTDDAVPPVSAVIRRFVVLPSARHLLIGSALGSMIGLGLIAFLSALISRRFGLPLGQAGLTTALISSFPAALATIGGGIVADRLAPRIRASYALVPAIGLLAAAPLYLIAFTRSGFVPFVVFTTLAALLQFAYLGVTVGTLNNMMHPRMRATANALTNIVGGLFGGLGPVLIGAMSDRLAATGLPSHLALGYAMAGGSLLSLWAAGHYFIAARTVAADMDTAREGNC